MGYFLRYIITDDTGVTLADIEAALKAVDPAYAVINIEFEALGDLMHGEQRCAIIEINQPDDEIFADDIAEFLVMVGEGSSPAQERVRSVLNSARLMVVAEAFWKQTNSEPTLSRLDPLWEWLFGRYAGLLQADNEGFYNHDGLILERRFML